MPEVEVGSIVGAGGVGHKSVKRTVRDFWWKFEGHKKTGDLAEAGARAGAYKVLQWNITENELQPQPLHSNTVHTAFSFDHDGQPFFMHVEVRGKLRKRGKELLHKVRGAWEKVRFPPNLTSSPHTTTLIHFRELNKFTTPLDEFEKRLNEDMQSDNMPHPIVVPNVQEQATLEGQSPTLVQGPSMDPPIEEDQPPGEQDPKPPTVDELMVQSHKVFEGVGLPIDTEVLAVAQYDDGRGGKPVGGLDSLKVDRGVVVYLVKIWILMMQIVAGLLGYGDY